MSSIVENKERIGSFTSSQIYRLCGGQKTNKVLKPFGTYVNEKVHEVKLGRSLDTGAYSQSIGWGELIEKYVFDYKLGHEYILESKETNVHPKFNGWAGSKDVKVPGVKISDIKCYYPKNFAAYADVLLSNDIEQLKSEYTKEYWQLVSNALIEGVNKAEAILYMPYRSELEDIRNYAADYDGHDQWRYRFIFESDDYQLPFLDDDSKFYTDLIKFEFELPQEDVEFLTNRVKLAIDTQKRLLR